MGRLFGFFKLLLGISLIVFVHIDSPASVVVGIAAGYLVMSGLICSITGKPEYTFIKLILHSVFVMCILWM